MGGFCKKKPKYLTQEINYAIQMSFMENRIKFKSKKCYVASNMGRKLSWLLQKEKVSEINQIIDAIYSISSHNTLLFF